MVLQPRAFFWCRDPEASGALEKPSVSAPASQPSTELPVVKAEEDEVDMVDEVAAMAGHGKSQDALATLEGALRPVERYAVHFLEEVGILYCQHPYVCFDSSGSDCCIVYCCWHCGMPTKVAFTHTGILVTCKKVRGLWQRWSQIRRKTTTKCAVTWSMTCLGLIIDQ